MRLWFSRVPDLPYETEWRWLAAVNVVGFGSGTALGAWVFPTCHSLPARISLLLFPWAVVLLLYSLGLRLWAYESGYPFADRTARILASKARRRRQPLLRRFLAALSTVLPVVLAQELQRIDYRLFSADFGMAIVVTVALTGLIHIVIWLGAPDPSEFSVDTANDIGPLSRK